MPDPSETVPRLESGRREPRRLSWRVGCLRVTPVLYGWGMPRKFWSAAEMEKLSRDEQQAVFDESIVTDLSEVPREFLAKVRADAVRLIESHETQRTD
jgi:hypothetical protein